jgi:hypothetical protein
MGEGGESGNGTREDNTVYVAHCGPSCACFPVVACYARSVPSVRAYGFHSGHRIGSVLEEDFTCMRGLISMRLISWQ